MKKFISIIMLMAALLCMSFPAFAEEALAPAAAVAEAAPAAPAAAPKLDTGDTAWMIVATALVMLMSIPGLALFYGGLAKTKDSLNTMAMTFVTFCIASLLWVIYGYPLTFGTDIGGFIGSTEKMFLKGRWFEQPLRHHPRVYLHRVSAYLRRDHRGPGERRLHRAHEVLGMGALFDLLDDPGLYPGGALGLGRRVPGKARSA